jgi:hypothetical protein
MVEVEVRSRVTGTSGSRPPVLVRLPAEQTTARELIRRTVEEQLRLAGGTAPRHRGPLLSDEEVRVACGAGAVRSPRAAPTAADEVARAHRAFVRGTFVVYARGRQITGLDEELTVRPGDPVVFLRLVALAGG